MGFFRKTGRVLRREWGRIRKYPIYPTLMIILPVISFLFFAAVFGEGTPRDMPIAVLDEDHSPLSRQLASMIDATPAAMVSYDIQDMEQGERMMREGKIEAIVYIPRNFEKDIYSNSPTRVGAYVNGTNIAVNGFLGKDLQTTVTTFSTGIQIQTLMKKGLSEKQAYNQAMPIYFDRHLLFNPWVNYGYFLMPSFMPMMLLIFTILLTVFAIGSELKNATAGEWMAAAGGEIWPALIGKMIPYTGAMFLMSLLMNTIMYKWVGVPLNGSAALLILAGFLFVLSYQSIGVLIISVLSNLRLSLSIAGGYSVLAFTFSGLTFPLMAMDWYVVAFSRIFPFTFYTDVFIDQAMRGAPVIYSIHDLGWMTVVFILLPLLCLPRLKKIATNETYWRRM